MTNMDHNIDKSFWGDHLEINVDLILKQHQDRIIAQSFVGRLPIRSRTLANYLDINTSLSPHDIEVAIINDWQRIMPFIRVFEATARKRTIAIIDVAKGKLSQAELESCKIGGNNFDRLALMWLLYLKDPENIELVFHLDRTQRKGHARMVISPNTPSVSADTIATFFVRHNLQTILDEYERETRSLRQSHCASILCQDDTYRVFIKRDYKPAFIAHGPQNTFGFEREWIVLEFEHDLRRLRICSDSPDVPIAIANRFASSLFHQKLAYYNEMIITPIDKVKSFLWRFIIDDKTLPLVEFMSRNSGLDGGPQLRLNNQNNNSISSAMRQLIEAFGNPLVNIDEIDSIKVLYAGKRIKIIFESCDNNKSFVVRYGDQMLDSRERFHFENMMKRNYNITVLSIEKRYGA